MQEVAAYVLAGAVFGGEARVAADAQSRMPLYENTVMGRTYVYLRNRNRLRYGHVSIECHTDNAAHVLATAPSRSQSTNKLEVFQLLTVQFH